MKITVPFCPAKQKSALILWLAIVLPILFSSESRATAPCNVKGFGAASWNVKQKPHQAQNRQADHFALVLSWSPGFCQWQKNKRKPLPVHVQFQCESNNNFGWIIHGLWGQSEGGIRAGNDGSHPAWCGDKDLPDLPHSLLLRYACMSPSARLLQHEWEKHGSCDFEKAETYFTTAASLYERLVLPDAFIPGDQMLGWLNRHNPHLRTTRQAWLNNRREIAICYDRNFLPTDCR